MSFLEKILAYKKAEIARKKNIFAKLEKKFLDGKIEKSKKNFAKKIKKNGEKIPKLIAEIKKKSPSRGEILPDGDAEKIAEIFEKSGAAAISFLTDEKFFGGKIAELKKISQKTNLPILAKDFFLCEEQILEARDAGADAILLMVKILKTEKKIRKLREFAEKLKMNVLTETHNLREIKIAENAGAKIIGVNSRDFSNLTIDQKNFENLLPKIPAGILRVAESGLQNFFDVQKISPHCDAMLIGTAIMSGGQKKIAAKIREFLGKKI